MINIVDILSMPRIIWEASYLIIATFTFAIIIFILVPISIRKKDREIALANRKQASNIIVEYERSLNQYILKCRHHFTLFDSNEIDTAFLEMYKIGGNINHDGHDFVISRINKCNISFEMPTLFQYHVYFTQYENCEFPLTFILINDKYTKLLFDFEGITLVNHKGQRKIISWPICLYIVEKDKVRIILMKEILLDTIYKNDFISAEDYNKVIQLLYKYGTPFNKFSSEVILKTQLSGKVTKDFIILDDGSITDA